MAKNPGRKTISVHQDHFEELHRLADETGVKFYLLCDAVVGKALQSVNIDGWEFTINNNSKANGYEQTQRNNKRSR